MGKKKIIVLHCTLTKFMTDGFDVGDVKGYPLGMICKSKTTGKWAATWNMVPNEGDSRYRYDTQEAAVQQLIDWEKESRDRLAAKGKQ